MTTALPDALRRWATLDHLPRAAPDLPAVGGLVKALPEDFEVEEIPAFPPSGTGDFLYLWIQKTDWDHRALLRTLAEKLAIEAGDIGTAGVKDRRAITRQTVSVPAQCSDRLPALDEVEGVEVLRVDRHEHKLRTGKLRGNRFSILLRDPSGSIDAAQAIVERLRRGIPNFYGEQRFGRQGATAELGWAFLQGERNARTRKAGRNRFLRRMAISAIQSLLFNDYLCRRIAADQLRVVLPGDRMIRRDSGGPFLCEDAVSEQARFDTGEIVTTGPMFGSRFRRAEGEAFGLEEAVLADAHVTVEDFGRFKKLGLGTRRPLLIWPEDLEAAPAEEGIRVAFGLPSGAYATVVMREFQGVPGT
jgi:tRNA pseudouridine13 synthase